MLEKIIIDNLTENGVSIKKQQYIVYDKKEYAIGEIVTKAYANSIRGRQLLIEEVTEPYKTIIFMIWGDVPTVTEVTE